MRHSHVRSGSSPALAALLLAALLSLLAAVPAAAAQRVALVIGNAAYPHIPALDNPVNDANDMTAALKGLGFEVFVGIDLDRKGMQALITRFRSELRDSEVALFYYAGHAFQVSFNNYLLPVDFRVTAPERAVEQTVALDDVLSVLGEAPGLKIVLLDACGDNPLRLPGTAPGLALVGSATDFLIAYATRPNAVAYDGEGRNGTFTGALLSHIHTPEQDISEMMSAVRKDVVAQTGGQQVPWEISALTRRFRFNDGPPTVAPETLFYQVAVRAADPTLMRMYLQRYPDGSHVGEVMAMLASDSGAAATAQRSLNSDHEAGEQLWQLAQRTRLRQLFQTYLQFHADGPHAAEAQRMLDELPAEPELSAAKRCEALATHPRDGTETTPGVPFELLAQNAVEAMRACEEAAELDPRQPRYLALLARASAAAGLRDRAVNLYQAAAERGDLRAMISLALLKENGDGVEKDPAGAMALYERAAAGGSADAAINLAVSLLEEDRGTEERERGIALLQKASEAGSAIATFNLGVLAQQGEFGGPGDAVALFERAAREGEPRAYRAAAVLLDEGRGTPRNAARASAQLLLGVASDDGSLLHELTKEAENWHPETLAALQQRLARAGLFSGIPDGSVGPALVQALQAWRTGGFNSSVLAG